MLTGYLGAIPEPGPLPRGCWLILCTSKIPAFPFSPQLFISSWIPALLRSVRPVPGYLDHFIFNVLRESLLQRLSNHRDLVPEKRDSCN